MWRVWRKFRFSMIFTVLVASVLPNLRCAVRRGPRASANSLFTVSLAESEADAFFPNGVCVSSLRLYLMWRVWRKFRFSMIFTVLVASVLPNLRCAVRRGPRASANSLFTVSLAESEADAFFPNGVCVSSLRLYLMWRVWRKFRFSMIFTVLVASVLPNLRCAVRRGPRASANSLFTVSLAESEADAFFPNGVCVSPIIL